MANAILPRSKFIHIPKCGGTAIQSVLWRIGCIKDHAQIFSEPHFGHLFPHQMPEDDRVNFAFVRNPLTWWHSWYWWNKTQPLSRFNGEELKTKSFDHWVADYGAFWLGMYTTLIKRYFGEDAKFPTINKVTKFGKIEHLFKDLQTMLDEIGEDYNREELGKIIDSKIILTRANTNIQTYNRKNISKETKQIIFETEKEIFNRFHYGINTN